MIDEEMTDGQNIAMALYAVAKAIGRLGFDGPVSEPGAIEGHTMMLRDTIAPMIAEAIRDGMESIADALVQPGVRGKPAVTDDEEGE